MSETSHLDVTYERVLPVWWAFAWRTWLYGVLMGAALGGGAGIVLAVAGRADLAGSTGALLGWLATIPISIVVLRGILRKQFGGFAIRLVRSE